MIKKIASYLLTLSAFGVVGIFIAFNPNRLDRLTSFWNDYTQVHQTYHYFINRFLTLLSNIFSNIYLSDMETCYKVMKLDIMSNLDLNATRYGIEPEIVAKIAKLNLRILELPITFNARSKKQGKKIGWKDGLAAIWYILKYNIYPLSEKSKYNLPKKYLK